MLSSKQSSKFKKKRKKKCLATDLISTFFFFLLYSVEFPLELKGKLYPNAVLDKAQPMKLDFEIEGPESIAISSNGNEIYTGVVGGEIVRINANGTVTTVAKFGQACGMTP